MKVRLCRGVAAVLTALALLLSNAASAQTEHRVALVIGNSAYTGLNPLPNPVNDATEVARTLQDLGFVVLFLVNARKVDIDNAIVRFRSRLAGADVGLFYYSGHGFQTSAERQHHPVNHIVPVDFRIPTGNQLSGTVALDEVLTTLEQNARLRLIFMDACRNNPQLETAAQRLGSVTRSVVVNRGFAPVRLAPAVGGSGPTRGGDGRPLGTLIAYAASPGRVAEDGRDRLSPFTKSLLKHMVSDDVPFTDVMGHVSQDVLNETGGQQRPWYVLDFSAPFVLRKSSRTIILP
jgi:uncharacterized caspase-like protein